MKQVSIYTTPTCTYCKMSKDFFKENNISYQEYNVAVDLEKRKEIIEKSGQMGVPVIFIDNEIVVGFDKARFKELLGL
ncbi:MAG: glutaredoxin domain-containing protein [Patescibacteria group bacterium]